MHLSWSDRRSGSLHSVPPVWGQMLIAEFPSLQEDFRRFSRWSHPWGGWLEGDGMIGFDTLFYTIESFLFWISLRILAYVCSKLPSCKSTSQFNSSLYIFHEVLMLKLCFCWFKITLNIFLNELGIQYLFPIEVQAASCEPWGDLGPTCKLQLIFRRNHCQYLTFKQLQCLDFQTSNTSGYIQCSMHKPWAQR